MIRGKRIFSTAIQAGGGGGGTTVTVVANYAALPAANTVSGDFYWCENSQGTAWLPGPLGGTYYPSGLYYSNGTSWEYTDTPYQATQLEVDAGTITDKFVSPATFANASKWSNINELPFAIASGTDTYTATISGVTSYAEGDAYLVRFTNGNTVAGPTININGLGARSLYRNNDGQLIGGDILANGEMVLAYDASLNVFKCIGTSPNTLFAYVTNGDSVTITKGQPVYAFSGTGDRMVVKLANNTSDATSAKTIGLVYSTSIAANQKGLIIIQGLLDGLSTLPTSTWSDGDTVYLGSTAGAITPTKPYAPNHLVYLGVVTTANNGSAGRMYVKVQNGYELDEIHDVDLVSVAPVNNNVLTYVTGSPNLWKPRSISTILGYTPANASGTTNQIAYFTSSTALGSLTTTTYPGLTELSYVKGVTSSIQTQFSGKQNNITLTTTGTSGAATLVGSTLNIPQYSGGGGSLPAWVETNATDLTLWTNGKGNILSNTSYGDQALKSNTSGPYNTAIGFQSLQLNTTGADNTSVGYSTLPAVTTGYGNTAIGSNAGIWTTTGYNNTAIGGASLGANTTGYNNTAVGAFACQLGNKINNTAVGVYALYKSTGSSNTAVGGNAARNTTTGVFNTAVGSGALFSNTVSSENIAIGLNAMYTASQSDMEFNITIGNNADFTVNNAFHNYNITIGYNASRLNTIATTSNIVIGALANEYGSGGGSIVAIGTSALKLQSSADFTTAIGDNIGANLTTGINNTILGSSGAFQLTTGSNNTLIGTVAGWNITTGSSNTFIGYNTTATVNVSGSVVIGKDAQATASNQFVVGSSGTQAGSVVTASLTSNRYWNVIINGTAYKILLST